MVSLPGVVFAAMTASRNEQSASQLPSLLSPVLVTVKVAATVAELKIKPHAIARKREAIRCGGRFLMNLFILTLIKYKEISGLKNGFETF